MRAEIYMNCVAFVDCPRGGNLLNAIDDGSSAFLIATCQFATFSAEIRSYKMEDAESIATREGLRTVSMFVFPHPGNVGGHEHAEHNTRRHTHTYIY